MGSDAPCFRAAAVGPKPTAIPYQETTSERGPSWQAPVSRAGGTPAHGTYRAAAAGADALRQRQRGISKAKKLSGLRTGSIPGAMFLAR
jgi:hypothetical protein